MNPFGNVFMCTCVYKILKQSGLTYYVPGIFLVYLVAYSLSLNLDVLCFPKINYSVAY